MLYCATDNLFTICVATVQVSVPYVIVRRKHWLKNFLFNHVGSVNCIISYQESRYVENPPKTIHAFESRSTHGNKKYKLKYICFIYITKQ